MTKPTNEVLAAKLDALRELVEVKFERTEEHFIRLNGQVAKNTEHRVSTKWLDKAGSAGIAAAVAAVIANII